MLPAEVERIAPPPIGTIRESRSMHCVPGPTAHPVAALIIAVHRRAASITVVRSGQAQQAVVGDHLRAEQQHYRGGITHQLCSPVTLITTYLKIY